MENKWLFLVRASATSSIISIVMKRFTVFSTTVCNHYYFSVFLTLVLYFHTFKFPHLPASFFFQMIWKVKNDQGELKGHFVMLNSCSKKSWPISSVHVQMRSLGFFKLSRNCLCQNESVQHDRKQSALLGVT